LLVPVQVFFFEGLSLIVGFATSGQSYFQLGPTPFAKKQTQRNEGQPFFGDSVMDFSELGFVEQ
jgi:hypothetical protein